MPDYLVFRRDYDAPCEVSADSPRVAAATLAEWVKYTDPLILAVVLTINRKTRERVWFRVHCSSADAPQLVQDGPMRRIFYREDADDIAAIEAAAESALNPEGAA